MWLHSKPCRWQHDSLPEPINHEQKKTVTPELSIMPKWIILVCDFSFFINFDDTFVHRLLSTEIIYLTELAHRILRFCAHTEDGVMDQLLFYCPQVHQSYFNYFVQFSSCIKVMSNMDSIKPTDQWMLWSCHSKDYYQSLSYPRCE